MIARVLIVSCSLMFAIPCSPGQEKIEAEQMPEVDPNAALIARAKSFELDTVWEPPPGDEIVHHTAGYAKILCSAVFITGLDPEDAAANVGGFTAPFESRSAVVKTEIDGEDESVRLTLASGVVRTAKRYASQGCITHPLGHDGIFFEPSTVSRNLPDPNSTPWPMGDVLVDSASSLDRTVLDEATVIAMRPGGKTLGFVVTHKGEIVAEDYGVGVDMATPFESWSMGKSLTGTLMGVLIQQGEYALEQPAPIPEWQNDGRKAIRIIDIMRMSSGIRIKAPQDPDYVPEMGYPDHLYLYTGENAFQWAASRPQEWPPNTVGRYRNTDPVLTNYLIRLAVEGRGENYHAFPQRALFDKLGMRSIVMETDPHGNFLSQGYGFASARDWARLGNLYLQDGMWEGERILPEGYVDYAFTLAPAWLAGERPIYGGGFLWRDLGFSIDVDYGGFAGAGGQFVVIIPEHDLVFARLGKYTGQADGFANLDAAIKLVLNSLAEGESEATREKLKNEI